MTSEQFDLSMEMDAQVDSFVNYLNNFADFKQKSYDAWEILSDMMNYWIKGDFNGFSTMDGLNDFIVMNPADFLGCNEKWIPKMISAMSDAPTMLVFGALHLIGKDCIILKPYDINSAINAINCRIYII